MDKTCLTPSIASDLNRSAKSQNLTQAKKNKNTSATNQQLLQLQIVQLKQKAHQSFMQVIQIQQLHQEEMQSFRQEYNTKCDQYESKISLLNERIARFQQQKLMVQRNYKHHLYQMQKDNLFSNIQPINFQQESKLDDSSILNFQEIIQTGCFNQKINAIKQEIAIQILSIHDKPISQRIMSMLQKLFQFMAHLNKQFINLHQVHMKLKNQHQLSNNMKNNPVISLVKVEDQFKSENKNIKMDYENMQKQNKLFSDKLKRISSDKMKIEKLLRQKEKKSIQLQDCLHKIVNYMHAKGIKIEQSLNFDISMLMGVNEDKSLDLNQFIQEELIKKTSLQSNRIEVGVIKRLRNNRN